MIEATDLATIRIVVVDDHSLIRDGTRAILQQAGGIDVVGTAANGADALALIERARPDVAILDLQLPDMNGLEIARRVKRSQPDVAVLILTGYQDGGYVRQLFEIGVRGYLPKTASVAELIAAVRAVASGRTVLIGGPGTLGVGISEPLTGREQEVLRLMMSGLRNAQIAERLVVSVKTVEFHVGRILGKLGVASRSQAIVRAQQLGLVSLDGVESRSARREHSGNP